MSAASVPTHELRALATEASRLPARAPAMEAALTLRPGKALEVETAVAEPDLVPEFSIARAHGRSLVGRAPQEVIAPVPQDQVTEVGDRQLALWAVQPLVEALPRGELVMLDSVGHLPWLEDPAAFGAVARDFVAERGGSPCRIHRSPAA